MIAFIIYSIFIVVLSINIFLNVVNLRKKVALHNDINISTTWQPTPEQWRRLTKLVIEELTRKIERNKKNDQTKTNDK